MAASRLVRGVTRADRIADQGEPMTQTDFSPQSPIRAGARAPFPLACFAIEGGYVALFNLACALAITAILGDWRHFPHILILSMAIGMLAFLLIDGSRLALWGEHAAPPPWPLAAIVLTAAPVAHYGGSALAGALTGLTLPGMETMHSAAMTRMLAFTLLATGAASLFFVNRNRMLRARAQAEHEKARAAVIARQALQTQLQLLQSQIEPHMLFNTLANLQGLIEVDPALARRMLDQLIAYLRATLSCSRADSSTLEQEFALMDAYLGLMAVRMGPRLSYALTLPEALRATPVPPMLLQPLVENAIRHGLEARVAGGHIAVSAARDGAVLTLVVSDSGPGAAAACQPGTRLGLTNTRDRLAALFGAHASLVLDEQGARGTTVRLMLPLPLPT
jgi:signal transduction histidine kinase